MAKSVVVFCVEVDLDPERNPIRALVDCAYNRVERSYEDPMQYFSEVRLPNGDVKVKDDFVESTDAPITRRIGF